MERAEALKLLMRYNRDRFHLRHALTVEGVMEFFADHLGYGTERRFWGNAGLLHDIDFEQFPDRHCIQAAELLEAGGASPELIHAVVSHGWNLTVEVKPEHEMEKVLYAADELTGLIWAVALMRPSRNLQDLELKSVKKKYKSPAFAAGCSRRVIEDGARLLNWPLDVLIEKTILAMRSCEERVDRELEALAPDNRS